jgi:hypothetical protein
VSSNEDVLAFYERYAGEQRLRPARFNSNSNAMSAHLLAIGAT